jgi:hypothetical protein
VASGIDINRAPAVEENFPPLSATCFNHSFICYNDEWDQAPWGLVAERVMVGWDGLVAGAQSPSSGLGAMPIWLFRRMPTDRPGGLSPTPMWCVFRWKLRAFCPLACGSIHCIHRILYLYSLRLEI